MDASGKKKHRNYVEALTAETDQNSTSPVESKEKKRKDTVTVVEPSLEVSVIGIAPIVGISTDISIAPALNVEIPAPQGESSSWSLSSLFYSTPPHTILLEKLKKNNETNKTFDPTNTHNTTEFSKALESGQLANDSDAVCDMIVLAANQFFLTKTLSSSQSKNIQLGTLAQLQVTHKYLYEERARKEKETSDSIDNDLKATVTSLNDIHNKLALAINQYIDAYDKLIPQKSFLREKSSTGLGKIEKLKSAKYHTHTLNAGHICEDGDSDTERESYDAKYILKKIGKQEPLENLACQIRNNARKFKKMKDYANKIAVLSLAPATTETK